MDEYLANARRVLERAERGHGRARIDRPCRDCKFYGGDLFGLAVLVACEHPVVKLAASQADDEYAAKRLGSCGDQRSKSSPWGAIVCGPDAALFEAA